MKCEGLETVAGICPEGKIPSLSEENREVWRLFQLMLPGLIREYGFDYTAIQIVFDSQRVTNRGEVLDRVVKILDVIEAERAKARKK